MKKIAEIRDILAYLAKGAHTIHYTGWLGYQNLGDEILLEAARESFAPAEVVWIRSFNQPLVERAVSGKRHELAMLGGGTQIGETSPIERFKSAISRSKAGLVFGAGVTRSLDGPVPAWLEQWGEVLRPLAYVGTRGPESAATLNRVGVNAQVLGDPVCWFSKPMEYWRPEANLVGMNIGHSHGHMYGQESAIQQQFAQLARELVRQSSQVEFFCVWPKDLETTRHVAQAAGIEKPVIHEIYEGAERFQETVRRMSAFIGIKLHAVALAMCANVPSLMVEYQPKCREFATTLGVDEFCVRSDSIDVEQALALVATLRTDGKRVASQMHEHAQAIRRRICDLSSTLLRQHGWTPN